MCKTPCLIYIYTVLLPGGKLWKVPPLLSIDVIVNCLHQTFLTLTRVVAPCGVWLRSRWQGSLTWCYVGQQLSRLAGNLLSVSHRAYKRECAHPKGGCQNSGPTNSKLKNMDCVDSMIQTVLRGFPLSRSQPLRSAVNLVFWNFDNRNKS